MEWRTAEYEKSQSKTFMAECRAEAVKHAKTIGYGEAVIRLREATQGEKEQAELNLRRSYQGTFR